MEINMVVSLEVSVKLSIGINTIVNKEVSMKLSMKIETNIGRCFTEFLNHFSSTTFFDFKNTIVHTILIIGTVYIYRI